MVCVSSIVHHTFNALLIVHYVFDILVMSRPHDWKCFTVYLFYLTLIASLINILLFAMYAVMYNCDGYICRTYHIDIGASAVSSICNDDHGGKFTT